MSFNLVPLLFMSFIPAFLAMRRMGSLIPGMYCMHNVGRFITSVSSSWLGACVFSVFSVVVLGVSVLSGGWSVEGSGCS